MKIAIALFCFAVSVAQAVEPLSIKGLTIGMSEKDAAGKFQHCSAKLGCSFFKKHIDDSKRNEMKSLAGATVEYAGAKFFNGKLESLHIEITANEAAKVALAFAEKYGTPTEAESQFKTAMGFSGKRYIWTWKIGEDTLVIESPYTTITDAAVNLYSSAHMARLAEKAKKDKKDL